MSLQSVVLEPDLSGHRYNFVRLLVSGLAAEGHEVILATDLGTLPIRRGDFGPLCDPRVALLEPPCPLGLGSIPHRPAHAAIRKALFLRKVIKRHPQASVYVPYGDGLAQMASAAGIFQTARRHGVRLEALLLKAAHPYLSEGDGFAPRLRAKASFRLAIAGAWDRLFFLDSAAYVAAQELARSERPFSVMPDPIPALPRVPPTVAQERLGLPMGRPYLGLVGAINARKGAHLLVEAYASSSISKTFRLLLAGRHDTEIRNLLSGTHEKLVRNKSIVSCDSFLSDDEFHSAMSALTLVVTPYPAHFGSASIVLRANALDLPTLGSDQGWMGWAIPRFELGWTSPVRDAAAFALSLERAAESSLAYRPSPRAKRIAGYHSEENFVAHWTARTRWLQGKPPKSGFMDWRRLYEL